MGEGGGGGVALPAIEALAAAVEDGFRDPLDGILLCDLAAAVVLGLLRRSRSDTVYLFEYFLHGQPVAIGGHPSWRKTFFCV